MPGLLDFAAFDENELLGIWNLKVYFACSVCEQIYRASQIRRPEHVYGRFKCEGCPATVHEWDGTYEYLGWTNMPSWELRGRRHL